MRLYNVPINELRAALSSVSCLYEGNLIFNRLEQRRNHIIFTLRVLRSDSPGHRLGFSRTANGNRRRFTAACWHAHRDLLALVFKQFPMARLKSAGGNYKGAIDFQVNYDWTGDRNIGSIMDPLHYRNACECDQ